MSRTSLGILVFLAGVTTFLSGSYAVSTIFGTHFWAAFASVALGFLYSCMVVAFYREVAGAQDKRAIWLRVPLVIAISFIVAAPLEMKFFERSINSELQVMNLKENETLFDQRRTQLDELYRGKKELQDSVRHYRAEVLKWDSSLEAETVGRAQRGRTGIAGQGPAYREALRNRDSSAAMLARYEAELKQYDEREAPEKTRLSAEYQKMSVEQPGDFLARYEALSELKSRSTVATTVSWGVRIFFMLIVLLPILVRVFLPYNEYDATVEARRRSMVQLVVSIANKRRDDLSKIPAVSSEESVVEV